MAVTGDPFEASFGPLYEKGLFIEVSAATAANATDQEAKRQAMIPKDRPNPFAAEPPSRDQVVAKLRAERGEAAAFIAKADRVLAPVARPSQSAEVDAILAEEGVTQDAWEERLEREQAERDALAAAGDWDQAA